MKIANFFRKDIEPSSTGTSFESSGETSFEQIYSSLDFSSSDSGKRELEITITDTISGKTASVKHQFILEE